MKMGIILRCRMNSIRLPGRALADVCGRPLVSYVRERLEPLRQDGIPVVIATSDDWHDDSLQDYCESQGIGCFRGRGDDIAELLRACAAQHDFDWFARLNDDSPFVDGDLLRAGLAICADRHFDFITNLAPRSYPQGVALEIFRTDWLEHIQQTQPLLIDPELVTARFYNNLHQIRYYNVAQKTAEYAGSRLTIAAREDLDWFRRFIAQHRSQWPFVSWQDAVADRQPLRRAA